MVFVIHPISPNPRQHYQAQVEDLCRLLTDNKGKQYRYYVFTLLCITGSNATRSLSRQGRKKFRDLIQLRSFRRFYPGDVRALQILQELDYIYANPLSSDIDHLRGAVAEVFAYYICKKIYTNSAIEIQIQIDSWRSGSIDAAGCDHERGHCIQSKCGGTLGDIARQKLDLDKIQELTEDKAQGFFITFTSRKAFNNLLASKGLDPQIYNVLDRTDLVQLESILAS